MMEPAKTIEGLDFKKNCLGNCHNPFLGYSKFNLRKKCPKSDVYGLN